jgi:hypothetical protein
MGAMQSQDYGEHVIDMDKIADAVGRTGPRPKFYYAEESQQNKYSCSVCSGSNDILGRYGYCSNCGTHNRLNELAADISRIRDRINSAPNYEACLKDTVAAFDSFARQIAKQLASRVPMTSSRLKEWERKKFHNLKPCSKALSSIFDIDIFKSLPPADIAFAILMFHRRHIYEHNGGEVDEKYILDSGDTSVRPKQVIRETRESAERIADVVMKLSANIHPGFHKIFPPEEMPVRLQRECIERIEKSKSFIWIAA